MSKKSTLAGTSYQRQQAIRKFFQIFQDKYGGNLPMDKHKVIVSSSSGLNSQDLAQLFQHQAVAVHVKQFYPKALAIQLGKELAQEKSKAKNWKISTSRGLESSDVHTIGIPYNIAVSQNQISEYFEGVIPEIQKRRYSFQNHHHEAESRPCLYPLDLLRLELDEVFPGGARLARQSANGGLPRAPGLPRIMKGPTRWKEGFIHVDEMGPLNTTQGLFSANVYLQLPGENTTSATPVLNIWPLGIRSRWDWYRNAILLSGLSSQDPEDQIGLRNALGTPVQIAVEPGDLVLLCVQRPHEAIGFQHGTRVSLQCFLQYSGMDQQLLIES